MTKDERITQSPNHPITQSLALVILFAFALRMFHAADALMWGDEGFSVFSASRDLLTITLDTTTIDPHPPLYYYLLHIYFALAGYSELALRFFSIFFGTLTIPLVFVTGKRMFGARVGWLAMIFATLAPFAVRARRRRPRGGQQRRPAAGCPAAL